MFPDSSGLALESDADIAVQVADFPNFPADFLIPGKTRSLLLDVLPKALDQNFELADQFSYILHFPLLSRELTELEAI